jgi:uncharacterized RDD family membrane protein YckC
VLIACPQCGAANDEHAQACYVCDATYPAPEQPLKRESAPRAPKPARKRASRPRKVKAVAVPPSVAVEEMAPIVEAVKEAVEQEAAQGIEPAAPPAPSPAEAALVEAVARALEEARLADPPAEAHASALPEATAPPAEVMAAEPAAEEIVAYVESAAVSEEPAEAALPEAVEDSEPEPVHDEQVAEVIGFAPAVENSEMDDEAEAVPVGAVAEQKEATTGARVLTIRSAAHDVNPYTASEPEWRREVSRRLQNYRAKRRRISEEQAQPELPFAEQSPPADPQDPAYRESLRLRANSRPSDTVAPQVLALDPPAEPEPEPETATQSVAAVESGETEESAAACAAPEPAEPPSSNAPIEVPVMPPQISFMLSDDEEHPHAPLVPVADVRERSRAAGIDLGCIAAGYGGFLGIFAMLGGHFSLGKPEAAIYALAFFLLYAAYFALFTLFGGVTPGMYFRGLSVVNFDGSPAAPRALAWRSLGYLISGMTLLGFLWAVWDEDHLTWHDRISQTYLTTADSPMWRDFAATAFPEHDIPGYDDEDESAT